MITSVNPSERYVIAFFAVHFSSHEPVQNGQLFAQDVIEWCKILTDVYKLPKPMQCKVVEHQKENFQQYWFVITGPKKLVTCIQMQAEELFDELMAQEKLVRRPRVFDIRILRRINHGSNEEIPTGYAVYPRPLSRRNLVYDKANEYIVLDERNRYVAKPRRQQFLLNLLEPSTLTAAEVAEVKMLDVLGSKLHPRSRKGKGEGVTVLDVPSKAKVPA